MMRLVERGLMYGNLVRVNSATMVARYNRALDKLIGRQTALESFHVDISGFSPEIGHELDDESYLNPNGCNRQFILLSPSQDACPLINAHFSSSRAILQRFIHDNRPALFALTARDAVIGELANSIYRIASVSDVLDIHTIHAEVDTPRGLVAEAQSLEREIDAFEASDSAWSDDVALARLISLADKVGDIRKHPMVPRQTSYRQGNFFTTHFGGLYVFRDVDVPAVIACAPDRVEKPTDDMRQIALEDRAALAAFLKINGLVQPIAEAPGLDAQGLLRQRLDFMLVDLLAREEDAAKLAELNRHDLRRAARRHYDDLPAAFRELTDALRILEQGRAAPLLAPEAEGYFYLLRGARHPDRDLVNHLLAHLTPLDVRQLFICNKERFYAHYGAWGEAKRSYVAEFLAKEYALDKKGTREALYGPEDPMDAAPDLDRAPDEDGQPEARPEPAPEPAPEPEAKPGPPPADAAFESAPDPWTDGPWGRRGRGARR